MDPQQQTPTPTPTTSTTPQPPPPPPQQQQQKPSQPPSSSNPNPNPTPTPPQPPKPSTLQPPPPPKPSTSQPPPPPQQHPRPTPTPSRAWQQHSHFSQFSSTPPGPTLSSPSPPSVSTPPPPRGGMAIGVPASSSTPHPPPPFSPSFGQQQQFGVLGRSGVNVPESTSTSSNSPARPGMGIMGSMGSSSQMRPGGISTHHQQRPAQSSPSLRPPSSPSNQPHTTQNFQGHSMLRVSSVSSPVSPLSPAPNTPQSMQSGSSLNQPWLSSGSQGKPPLPPPSYRAPINSPSMPQRSHIPQQHHPMPTASQQQHISSAQPPQPSPSHHPQDHYGQQFPPSRVPQSITHQQQMSRMQVSGNQKPSSLTIVQPNTTQPGAQSKMASAESDESGNRILSKRSIHELVNQIDPLEKLDPEVEDILVDIAEEFVDSITTFGCSLAKHRKSDTLEAKDILLHLERNWNMTLPGFSSDEIKSYRKPHTNDIHKERLAVIKKSIVATEVASARNSVGHAAINAKGNLAKTPANFMSSPNLK